MPAAETERRAELTRQAMVRLTEKDHRDFEAAAREEGRPLANWLRRQGRLALKPSPDRPEPRA